MTTKIHAISLVRNMEQDLSSFLTILRNEIITILEYNHKDYCLIVFPEYMFRTTPLELVLEYINGTLKNDLSEFSHFLIVLGTVDVPVDGNPEKYYNSALVVYKIDKDDFTIKYVPKTQVLESDIQNNVIAGTNPGAVILPLSQTPDDSMERPKSLNVGVLVCADLYNYGLCYDLVMRQNVDVLLVTAWTATSKGGAQRAKLIWNALCKTRTIEFAVTVAVADHLLNHANKDVGNVTNIYEGNCGYKVPIEENVYSKTNTINISVIHDYRKYWFGKGFRPNLL